MAKNKRLTNDLRDEIRRRVVESKMKPLNEAHGKLLRKLAEDIYADVVPDTSVIEVLPDGYVARTASFKVNLGGMSFSHTFDQARPMPYLLLANYYSDDDRPKYQVDHRFTKRFEKIHLQEKQLDKQEDELKRTCRSVLLSVSTIPKLLEAWPEVEKFIPDVFKPPAEVALAVQVDSLKKLLVA